jgi:hypothetical protein
MDFSLNLSGTHVLKRIVFLNLSNNGQLQACDLTKNRCLYEAARD